VKQEKKKKDIVFVKNAAQGASNAMVQRRSWQLDAIGINWMFSDPARF
jgi:hypothetical protein